MKKAEVQRLTIRLPKGAKELLKKEAYRRAMSTALYSRCLITQFTEQWLYSGSRSLLGRYRLDTFSPSKDKNYTRSISRSLGDFEQITFRVPSSDVELINEIAKAEKSTTAEVIREVLLCSLESSMSNWTKATQLECPR